MRERSHHLSWIEGRDVPGTDGQPMRLEAAALRRDIREAQMHIDRLYRRYLSSGEHIQQLRPAGEQHPVMVGLQAK
ncbi:MAG: hypothetical protein WBZ37_27030 [Mycobacterium sp.]